MNRSLKIRGIVVLAAAVALTVTGAGSALAGNCGSKSAATAASSKDIVDTAVSAGDFNTLVTAVQEAGLVETLKGEGPFTVFAPTDEAFAAIPPEKLQALLADKEALTAVLTYHVVPGSYAAADVVARSSLRSVQGSEISVSTDSGAKVDDANIIMTDIQCSNGVIHVIDAVIVP